MIFQRLTALCLGQLLGAWRGVDAVGVYAIAFWSAFKLIETFMLHIPFAKKLPKRPSSLPSSGGTD